MRPEHLSWAERAIKMIVRWGVAEGIEHFPVIPYTMDSWTTNRHGFRVRGEARRFLLVMN